MSFKMIGIGEVLWDLLPAGPQLGGAPANFAYHTRALGADAGVVSRVGNDHLGRAIRHRFGELGIADDTVQVDDEAPTGTVTVALSGNGIPHFTIHENVAWDRLAVTPQALAAVRAADALCFGSLAQRSEPSRASIQRLAAAALVIGLLHGNALDEINARAGEVARHVCSCAGATPPLPKEMCDRFAAHTPTRKVGPGKMSVARA